MRRSVYVFTEFSDSVRVSLGDCAERAIGSLGNLLYVLFETVYGF